MFFLMVICHQPYSEIVGEVDPDGFVRKQGIPFELVQSLMKIFEEKVNERNGDVITGYEVIRLRADADMVKESLGEFI